VFGNVRRNAIVPSNLPLGVYVDFAEDDFPRFAFCGRELLEDGRDDFARAAPIERRVQVSIVSQTSYWVLPFDHVPIGIEVDYGVGCGGGEGAEVR
jgi:hypothetical protein